MTKYNLSIVIPAYNEEANIEEVVRRSLEVLRSLADRYEVVVMDDASRDRTGQILDKLAAQQPNLIRVLHHEKNKGANLSLIELFRAARNELVFFLPADKQILPEAIRNYIPLIERGEADIVLGWRRRRADPFYRALFNRAYLLLLRLFLGIHYQDACASDLYKKSILDQIQMKSWGRLLQAEIATKASLLGYRVKEIEVEHYPRIAGKQTGINPKTAWLSFLDILRLGREIRGLKKERKKRGTVARTVAVILICFLFSGCSKVLSGEAKLAYEFPEKNLDHVGGLAWSPDGDKILFHTLVRGEKIEKYSLFSLKDHTVAPLQIFGIEDSQNFSPDGSKIIFSDGAKIYEYDIKQVSFREIPVSTGLDSAPLLGAVYSSDGKKIAFCRGGRALYVAPSDGGMAESVAEGLEDEMAYWIRWSPDMKTLWVWLLKGPTVAKVDIATGRVEKIVRGDGVSPLPDGEKIIYLNHRLIYLRDLAQKRSVLVSRERNVRDLVLSAGGNSVVFVQENQGRFFLKTLMLPEEITF